MRYEPIKRSLGRFFSGPLFMRKFFYSILDLLLLRTWHVNKALRKIRKELPDQANILDAGCGFGQYAWRMCRMNKHWKIKAVDIDKEQVEDCTLFFGKAGMSERISCSVADLTTFSDPESYDFILSVDVMEHIREDETVFHNLYMSLKTNGMLLISTPSDIGGSGVRSDEDKSFIGEHVRDGYSIREITRKLAVAGFNSIEALYTYGKPGNISWHLLMKYPVRMLNASFLFLILLPFYYAVVFPVSMILNIFDLRLTHKKGTGLLVTARKLKR
jgi:SAM-dependent methyltransferase